VKADRMVPRPSGKDWRTVVANNCYFYLHEKSFRLSLSHLLSHCGDIGE